MMATRFNQEGGWFRNSAQQGTAYQGKAPLGRVGGLTTEELFSEKYAQQFRRFALTAAPYELSSPERMRNLQTEPSQTDRQLNRPREEFWSFQQPVHGSDNLFTAFDEAQTPACNAELRQNGGEIAHDHDYRPGMNGNKPLPAPCENYTDVDLRRPDVAVHDLVSARSDLPFPMLDSCRPLLSNPSPFADRRGRGLRGGRFHNHGRGGGRGGLDDSQHRLRHNAPFMRWDRSRLKPAKFFDEPISCGFERQPQNMEPRRRGFYRDGPGNRHWRSSYPTQEVECFDGPPYQEPLIGNMDPVHENFRRHERELQCGFSNQAQWHHEFADRHIEPPSWRFGSQCQNVQSMTDQNFEINEHFEPPFRSLPQMSNNQNYGDNDERFEDFGGNVPGRFLDGEPPLNRFGLQLNNGAPPGSTNSNVPQFRPLNFDNRWQGDRGPISPHIRRDTDFHQGPHANVRIDSTNGRLVPLRQNARSMRLSATSGIYPPRQRLRRLNNLRGRGMRIRLARAWQNRRNSFHGNENLHPGASDNSPYGPRYGSRQVGSFFLGGSPNCRLLPRNKLRNFDLEAKEEDAVPPPEENWDAAPPAAPFMFRIINRKSTFMISNAAPKRKKKADSDEELATIENSRPNAPAEVVDVVDGDENQDAEDRGMNSVKHEMHDVESNGSEVVDLVSPRKEKPTPDTEFLIELSISSDDSNMSCEIVSDFSSQKMYKHGIEDPRDEARYREESGEEKSFHNTHCTLAGDGNHDDALEIDEYHFIALEEEECDDNALEGDKYFDENHDNALKDDENHDNALEEEEFDDNALEGDEYHDNALEGESHDDDVKEEENFLMKNVHRVRNFRNVASRHGDSQRDSVDVQLSSGDEFPQRDDSDDESVHEIDLVNIHPDPDCPEDFLDIDNSPGALPIPTGDNQANRPDVTRKRVYNGPAPSGLTSPPPPHDFNWRPGPSRRIRSRRGSSFIKRSHLIKMHHQSPSYDILHQEFPDDCNSDRIPIVL